MKLTRRQIQAIKEDREEWFDLFHDGERPEQLYERAFNMGVKIGAERALAIGQREHRAAK